MGSAALSEDVQAEGVHRKMKLIQRRACSFRNFENYGGIKTKGWTVDLKPE